MQLEVARRSVWIPDWLWAELSLRAEDSHVSYAAYIREAVIARIAWEMGRDYAESLEAAKRDDPERRTPPAEGRE